MLDSFVLIKTSATLYNVKQLKTNKVAGGKRKWVLKPPPTTKAALRNDMAPFFSRHVYLQSLLCCETKVPISHQRRKAQSYTSADFRLLRGSATPKLKISCYQ